MLLPRLRARTADLHEKVERAVGLTERLGSVESYTALLARNYGFYRPLEARLVGIEGYAAAGIDLTPRLKTSLLRDDLLALGQPADVIDRLPTCTSLPEPHDLGGAFGCLYVLEGATLGGQFVRKEIKRVFGLEAGTGCSFYAGYGDAVGPMWRSFCASLEEYARLHPEQEDATSKAAVATFAAFETWFSS